MYNFLGLFFFVWLFVCFFILCNYKVFSNFILLLFLFFHVTISDGLTSKLKCCGRWPPGGVVSSLFQSEVQVFFGSLNLCKFPVMSLPDTVIENKFNTVILSDSSTLKSHFVFGFPFFVLLEQIASKHFFLLIFLHLVIRRCWPFWNSSQRKCSFLSH